VIVIVIVIEFITPRYFSSPSFSTSRGPLAIALVATHCASPLQHSS
jgi:hypothetical protein